MTNKVEENPHQPIGWTDPEAGGLRIVSLVSLFGTVIVVLALELLGGNVPGADLEEVSFETFRTGALAREIETDFSEQSIVAEKVRPGYNEFVFRLFNRHTERVVVGKDGWLFEPSNARNYPPPQRRGREDLLERHYEAVTQTVSWFEERGSRVAIVVVPNKWAFYPDKLPDQDDPPRSIYPDLVAELSKRGNWVVDPTLALTPRADGFDTYFPNDTHWTDQGCTRMAELVAKEVTAAFGAELPGEEQKGRLHVIEGRRWEGDLQRMLGFEKESGTHRSLLAERTQIVAVDENGKQLFDPVGKRAEGSSEVTWRDGGKQEIVLCGTSFAHTLRFGSKLSVLLGRKVEDRSLPGVGPTLGLLRLARQIIEGERKPPALIVWEFPEKHVYVRQREFLRPLEAFNAEQASFSRERKIDELYPPSTRVSLVIDSLEGKNVEIAESDVGTFACTPTSGDPMFLIDLKEPLPSNEGWAVCYRIEVDRKTTGKILFDWGSGLTRLEELTQPISGRGTPELICIPVKGPDGRVTKRFRLDAVDCGRPFTLTDLHLRRR